MKAGPCQQILACAAADAEFALQQWLLLTRLQNESKIACLMDLNTPLNLMILNTL